MVTATENETDKGRKTGIATGEETGTGNGSGREIGRGRATGSRSTETERKGGSDHVRDPGLPLTGIVAHSLTIGHIEVMTDEIAGETEKEAMTERGAETGKEKGVEISGMKETVRRADTGAIRGVPNGETIETVAMASTGNGQPLWLNL